MVVIGGIIGSGIFINPYIVARQLDSPALVLAAWAVGGAVAIAGAFAYAELGQLLPRAGGQYVYLRDAWHPLVGFLYGWALLFMIETGAMAAVAIAFARVRAEARRRDARRRRSPLAIAAIVVLSAINYLGVKPGSRVLNVFVVLKVAALAVLILFAWFRPRRPAGCPLARVDDAPSGALAFGAALIPILFAYGGWQNANYVAEEMRDPERHLPRSLIVGTLAVVAIYLLVNIAYLRTLGLDGLAATTTPAADAAGALARRDRRALRRGRDRDLDVRLPQPRDPRADARLLRDGGRRRVLPALARLHPRFQTPGAAIVAAVGVGDRCSRSPASTAICSTRSCSRTGSSSA